MTSFLDLPGEIRSLIYTHVARTGRLALALYSTSKLIRREGARSSSKYLIFKIRKSDRIPISLEATPLIQRSSIRVNLDGDLRGIEYFCGSKVIRKFCEVLISYGTFNMNGPHSSEHAAIHTIKELVEFKRLSLRLYTNCAFETPLAEYQELEKELAPSLGPGKIRRTAIYTCYFNGSWKENWSGEYRLDFKPYKFGGEALLTEVSNYETTMAI